MIVKDTGITSPSLAAGTPQKALQTDNDSPVRKAINFGAGPAALPLAVLEQTARDLVDFGGLGLGVAELSHRTEAFEEGILSAAERDLFKLLGVTGTTEWQLLWMTGGGTAQFSAVPLNLLDDNGASAEAAIGLYFLTGTWSQKAYEEAVRLRGTTRVKALDLRVKRSGECGRGPGREGTLRGIELSQETIMARLATEHPGLVFRYAYYCDNETVDGIEFPETAWLPKQLAKAPVRRWVCDASSNFLSRRIDLSSLDLVYAGVQKNLGPAGVTLVLLKKDLLQQPSSGSAPVATCLDYRQQMRHRSLLNTPPVLAIHMTGLVLRHLLAEFGDLKTLERCNGAKAGALYGALERHSVFWCDVVEDCRSRMNVVFKAGNEAVEGRFLEGAEFRGLLQLKGHRSVGGLRASLYNAISVSDVETLISYLDAFAEESV
jgi:phosphoserine aminotransferase